jgi:hypothetical protein
MKSANGFFLEYLVSVGTFHPLANIAPFRIRIASRFLRLLRLFAAILPAADKPKGDVCKTGVAASRQRAALFNLLEKCGGLPTAATMKGSLQGSQKGLTGHGRGASCPQSQDTAAKDIK